MTYKEYCDKIAELRKQQEQLTADYISEHSKYKVGDRIKIIERKSETIAEVFALNIHHGGSIEPLCYKVKKDGTVSSFRAYVWFDSKVEKL